MLARRNRRPALRADSQLVLRIAALLAVLLGLGLGPAAPQSAARAVTWSGGLIPDQGGINDNSFNALAYQGLQRAQTDLGVTGMVYADTTTGGDYFTDNLNRCVSEGNQLCITVGFAADVATITEAAEHTDTRFAIVDVTYTDYPENLRGITFDMKPAAFLAGALA